MSDHLHHKMAVLHQSLLHGKLPRNLHWTDAVELIGHLGQVEAQGNDEFTFAVGAQKEFFKRPHTPELGVAEVSRLRKFLKQAGSEPANSEHVEPPLMVVVIDHHTARIFQDPSGTRLQGAMTIEPYDPHHFHHHLIHRKEAHYEGDRVPEENSFYEEVAKALVPAQEIVLIGHGTGKSSAVDALVDYLKNHHSEIFRRITTTEMIDLSAVTEPEIDMLARKHMITAA